MRAAKIKEHPSFLLMKQTDVQSIYYMQMPRWLFSMQAGIEALQTGGAGVKTCAGGAGPGEGGNPQPPKDKPPAKPIPADDPPPAIPNYGGIEMVPISAVLGTEDEGGSDGLPRR